MFFIVKICYIFYTSNMGVFNKKKRIDDYTKQDIESRLNKANGWIDEAIEEINNLDDSPEPIPSVSYSLNVGASDSDVRYSLDVDAYISKKRFENWAEKNSSYTFQEKLLDYIDRKCMTNREFYKAANLDRKLFSRIKNNIYYRPTKETAVACCIGLKLDLDESKELLGLAGYELSLSIKWDKVIYYCLLNEIYDFDSVNYLLYLLHEKGIRTNTD